MSSKKKQKSKDRLDKFYHLAKDTGYRSRAAFKLIQINKKYKFLENANSLVDLCAAPGGWLQVAEKQMPLQSVKIGVDLVGIKPIPNCLTFIQDITVPECVQLILREMAKAQLNRVDVVLNDGAPNVGASWTKDAFTQIELVLEAFKLATKVLRKGGTFVSKVFRSSDYSSLIWVLNKFFGKVEACKPEASRNVSAEIFVVCLDYLHPDYIDERFFDCKYVFKDTEYAFSQSQLEGQINSIDKLFEKRRKRQGYDDNAPQSLYQVLPFQQLLEAHNPFPLLFTYSKIQLDEQQLQSYLDQNIKQPDGLKEICEDIQVLGKREVTVLLKWIKKIKFVQKQQKQSNKEDKQSSQEEEEEEEEKEKEEEEKDIDDEEEEEEVDEKLAKEIKARQDKEENRIKKKERKQLMKIAKAKASSMNMVEGNEDTELFSFEKHRKNIQKVGYMEVEEPKPEEPKGGYKGQYKLKDNNETEDNLQYIYNQQQLKDKEYKDKKQQENIQKYSKNKHNDKEFDEDYIRAKQFLKEEGPKDVLEGMEDLHNQKAVMNKKWFDQQIFQDLKKKIGESRARFNNPLSKDDDRGKRKPADQQVSDVDTESEEDKINRKSKKIKKQNKKAQGLRQTTQENKLEREEEKDEVEIVKERQPEDYDFDDLAENLALAKKMMRKKQREAIIDSTYNRFSFNDEDTQLPSWFIDDEKKHNIINLPITKQEVQVVKERLMAINSRQPKKVLEAKWRKKIKLARKLQKAKQKAEAVFEQDELSNQTKMKQIRSIYRKELNTKKDQKQYVVGKAFKAGGAKGGKGTKFVDRKLKGDRKMEKRAEKKKKKINVDPNRSLQKKSKKIQKNRKKRK